jgi:endonuclease/exonuclease/phosphatase (EEP) superfamily protein YafD
MRARIDIALGVVLVALVVVGALRWADTTWRPVIVLQSVGPFVVIGLSLLVIATLLARRWWMLVPVGVCAAIAWALALPGFFASTVEAPVELTVMAANLDVGQANADQVMAAVRAQGVDVLVLTEVTPDVLERLDEAGLGRWLPRQTGAPHADASTGTMILTRLGMTVVSGTADAAVEQTPSLQPEVVLEVGSTPVRLKAVHPVAPVTGATDQWRAGLSSLDRWKEGLPEDEALVIAGDFNASAGNPAFRRVASGLVDAQTAAGLGWIRTWPVVGQRVPPFVALDHVLSRGLSVVDAGQVAFHGSDHFLVWAKYALPPPTSAR